MIYFVIGAAGTLTVLGLLSLGAFLGWKARERFTQRTVQEFSEEEHRRILEEQRAFEAMLSYNIDTAYGVDSGVAKIFGGAE